MGALKPRIKLIIAAVLTAGTLVFVINNIENHINPLVLDMSLSNLNSIVLRECNDAVDCAVRDGGLSYESLIKQTTGSGGEIKSLTVDYQSLNVFKSRLARDVQSRIDRINSVEVYIPFMSLFSNKFYSAAGFPVKVKVMTDENVSIDFEDKFESAGVNQTRHRILVKITAEMGVNLPVRGNGDDIVTEIPIAETVIVGEVPTVVISD